MKGRGGEAVFPINGGEWCGWCGWCGVCEAVFGVYVVRSFYFLGFRSEFFDCLIWDG